MTDNLMNENPIKEEKIDTKNEPELAPLNKEQIKKKLIILGAIVIVVVAGLFMLTRKVYVPPVIVEGCNPGDNFSQTTGLPCGGEAKETPCLAGELFDKATGEPCVGAEDKTATPGSGSPTYQAALKTYEGRSVLLDAACVATPASLMVPIGTKVMIANNSQKTLALSIQNKKANLLPYYYMVSSIDKSGEFPVTCNGKVSGTVSAK